MRQPRSYSCGPTAIINAAKWAGFRCSLKRHHDLIASLCYSTFDMGTEEHHLDRVLRRMLSGTVTIRKRYRPTLQMLREHLSSPDRAVVLLYWRPGPGHHHRYNRHAIEGHYTLITQFDGQHATLINDEVFTTIVKTDRRSFREKISFNRRSRHYPPMVWLLRKL